MTATSNNNRKDAASEIIKASPQKIYAALTSPEAIATWKPPGDMTCRIYEFNPEEGGTYRMAFVYPETDNNTRGKTSEHEDVFTGRFLELVQDKKNLPTGLALSLIDYFLILNFKYELPCSSTRIFTADRRLPVSRF